MIHLICFQSYFSIIDPSCSTRRDILPFWKKNFIEPIGRSKKEENREGFTRSYKYTAISIKVRKKVHATMPKGIVGGFEFTVLQRNLREWHERPWTCVCECSKQNNKLGLTATVSGTANWSYPILAFGIVACTFSGVPNVNFRKMSVQKTIWDLEFSEHLL